MPNWCYTDYYIKGKDAEKLYETMHYLEALEESYSDNGFGKTWCGNLRDYLGGNEDLYCRGQWEDLDFNKGILSFRIESAWGELDELREFICSKFDIEVYYYAEETGCGIYVTNDRDQEFFKFSYIFYDPEEETYYLDDLGELIGLIKSKTGFYDIKSYDDCVKAIDLYNEEDDERDWLGLNEVDVVGD
jgi:hypothetical protein